MVLAAEGHDAQLRVLRIGAELQCCGLEAASTELTSCVHNLGWSFLTNSENGGKRNVCKPRSSVNCIAHEIRSAFVMSVGEHCPFGGPSIVEQRNLYNVCIATTIYIFVAQKFPNQVLPTQC
jgi:hypothetical protein